MADTIKTTCDCPRCCGAGRINAFSHVLGGVCFQCNGAGKVAYKVTKQNRFSAINAMKCRTLAEANAYRLAVFAERFPELVSRLEEKPEIKYQIANGMWNLRDLVGKLAA